MGKTKKPKNQKKQKELKPLPFKELSQLQIAIIDGADKLDSPKKRIFVKLYNQLYGHISNSCLGTGIVRQTYYDWLEKDQLFRELIMQSEMNLNDKIRDVLIQKAATGDMTAVIFYLKKRHPDFKELPNNIYVPMAPRVDFKEWGEEADVT